MNNSPLSQFDVVTVIPFFFNNCEVSLTNLSLTILLSVFLNLCVFQIFLSGHLIPRPYQKFLELIFMLIFRTVYQQVGKSGIIYFPFIFALFLFILMLNFLSMTPYGFAATSHLI